MASLDMAGSQPANEAAAQAQRWEKIGRWTMAGYWLALLGILVVGGMTS